MNLENFLNILKQVVDICLVWILFYYILKNVRKNVKFSLLFKGIVAIIIVKLVSDKIGLTTIGLLFEYLISWGPLAIIIIFQPEIRGVLEQLGKTQLLGRHKTLTVTEREKIVSELGIAVDYLRKNKDNLPITIKEDLSEFSDEKLNKNNKTNENKYYDKNTDKYTEDTTYNLYYEDNKN